MVLGGIVKLERVFLAIFVYVSFVLLVIPDVIEEAAILLIVP